MKKMILSIFALLLVMLQANNLKAQATFTADLELISRDTTRYFTLNYNDTVRVDFSVVNHGPDDIDTSNFIVYSMTGIPSNFFLVVQTDAGLPLLPNGDTIDSRGLTFIHSEDYGVDSTFEYCYFLRTTEDADSFIHDANQTNDTLCFYITYKTSDTVTSIKHIARMQNLKISPNPASDFVNVPINDMQNQGASLKVYSIDGRVVYQQKIINNQEKRIKLNVAGWPKGMYILDLQSEKGVRTGRFVVQ